MHYITAAPPARGEGGTEGRGASGQPSTFIPVFLLTLAASVPGGGGFREQPSRASRQDKGSDVGKIPGPGQEVRACCCPPG